MSNKGFHFEIEDIEEFNPADPEYTVEEVGSYTGAGRPAVHPVLQKMKINIRALVTRPFREMVVLGIQKWDLDQLDKSNGISHYLRMALYNQLKRDGITQVDVKIGDQVQTVYLEDEFSLAQLRKSKII
jgi:hypothetical protein